MALFENKYKTSANTELERTLRELEENKNSEVSSLEAVTNNINFAQHIHLISEQQAERFKERVEKLRQEHYHLQKTEYEDIVDDFENPRERAERYQKMDDYLSQIREKREAERSEGEPSKIPQKESNENGDRTHDES